MTNSSSEETKKLTGVDSSGQAVDLSDFEEAYYTSDQVEMVLQEYNKSLDGLEEGQVVRGKILRITNKEVIVDVNFKSEGIIPLFEFKNVKDFKPGDEIDVYLEQVEDNEGQIILSKSRADFLKVWDRIFDSYEKQETIEGRVLRRIKGGVVVDLFGIDAFLPGSQIDLRQIPDMDTIIGQTYKFRVIKVNKVRRNIVVSRRVILEEDRSAMRGKILAELEKGQIREGTVKNITDFGAFIDLGGVDGLLHITDMSWGRVNHPSEIVALGDRLKVKVLDFNENKERISLGIKQLSEHPWKGIEEKYPEGAKVRGKIVSITDYGAFLELEKGIEGLIHISEMSWTQHIKHPSKIVGVGDIIEAMVLKIDKANQKISLGIKQLEPDPWEKVPGEFHPGDVVSGKIRNLAAFGAFVELKEGVDGLIHISDMSWTKKINHPGELVKKGDTVEVKVLDVDVEKRRISLGVKQLSDDPWPNLVALYALGTEITECEVVRILDRGVVVNLTDDVEGFIPLNQLGQDVSHPSRLFKVGDKIPAEVVEFDLDSHKIVMSIGDYFRDKDAQLLADFWAKYPLKPATETAKPAGKPASKGKKDDGSDDAAAVPETPEAPAAEAPEAAE
jgi:small subunit ribosomal protein S1